MQRKLRLRFNGENAGRADAGQVGKLSGIVNGIDYDIYNPQTDKDIYRNYSVENFRKEKIKNKLNFKKSLDLHRTIRS